MRFTAHAARILLTWNGVSPGCLDRINAISPATCGAAKLSSTATLVGIAETLEERMWIPPDLSEAGVHEISPPRGRGPAICATGIARRAGGWGWTRRSTTRSADRVSEA